MAEQLNAGAVESLKDELLAQRERYNTLFTLAKRARPRLEGERFLEDLQTFVAPIAALTSPGQRPKVVAELYSLTLELSGVELFERSPAVRSLWLELLPGSINHLQDNPSRVVASLSNAVYNLEREPGADWKFWLGQMKHLSEHCAVHQEWLQLGQVLAWVSGMAHLRESACALAHRLPKGLVERVVPRWDKVESDPWWPRRPAPGQMKCIHKLGGFIGFGGVFRKPPEVVTAGVNQFLLSDGVEDWLLFCDGFGATLKRVADFPLQQSSPSPIQVSLDGALSWQGTRFSFPDLAPVLSFDGSGEVLVVTSELSHSVHVLLGSP